MTLRKRAFFFPLLCLALTLFTFACEKDELIPTTEPGTVAVEARLAAALGKSLNQDSTAMDGSFDSVAYCFQFNFPLSFVTVDGQTYVVTDAETEIDSNVLIANFVYPFAVTLADGSEREITDFAAFLGLLTDCYGDFEDWEDDYDDEGDDEHDEDDCPLDLDPEELICFDFVFPLEVTDGETTTTIADEAAFFAFVEGIDTTDAEDYDFIYPFEVRLLEDESTLTIEDEDAFEDLLDDCFDDYDDDDYDDDYEDCILDVDPEEIICFDFVFPLKVTDGETITTLADEEAFFAFVEGIDSTDAEGYDFVYPFDIFFLEDESTETIEDEEDFIDALEDCLDFDDDWDGDHDDCPIDIDPEDLCFEFVFPLEVTDGETVTTISDEEAFFAFVESIDLTDAEDYDFVYPFEVRLLEDEGTVTIEDEDAFEDLLDDCYEDYDQIDFDGLSTCFTIDYPISLVFTNPEGESRTTVVDSDNELTALLTAVADEEITVEAIFPVTVVLTAGQETVVLESEADLDAVLEGCDD